MNGMDYGQGCFQVPSNQLVWQSGKLHKKDSETLFGPSRNDTMTN